MANYAGIAIGINHYQFLQPLNYGQADAQRLQGFFVEQAHLQPSEFLLLTDTSPPIDDVLTYPNRENILRCLDRIRQSPASRESWRWFLFSGCGVSWDKVDYLMPIDGNPDDIPGTGIPIECLFSSLKTMGSNKILVLLDINRSPGMPSGEPVGAETVELAYQMGISLILSSQLNQFSHEASALGNGLFTSALLEALRYYHTDITLENLEEYLRERLPELSQHHWRPVQIPLTVIPLQEYRQQQIWPEGASSPPENQWADPNTDSEATKVVLSEDGNNLEVRPKAGFPGLGGAHLESEFTKKPLSVVKQNPNSSLPTNTDSSNQRLSDSVALVSYSDSQPQTDTEELSSWREWLFWGSGIALLLGLVSLTVVRNQEGLISQQVIKETDTSTLTTKLPETTKVRNSPVTLPTASKSQATPAPLPNSKSKPLETKPQKSLEPSLIKANQAALDQARQLVEPKQASVYSDAIAIARQVKPGDPLYEQTQKYITRWSQSILALATKRAKKSDFEGAIAAAQLVPEDNPSVYALANDAIKQWQILAQQKSQNQQTIQTAIKQVQRNQASSYNRAIATLRKIPPGQPKYATAQALIAQASDKIYGIAKSRASRGKFLSAINTAKLVPKDTPYYEAAQEAIARWEQGRP
ncbi:caspase family protein [Moorena sp. SIO4G3]|uniref:caspase family protein n=1 Tax=Moorena sp. SIO4G3 TaxID=2607821 RepID=UPI00142AF72E|nr:caspase family protein [Moorena sp. SIO4G3]NEO75315.1 hypothetical protein [Moorena sp. SIO4G3]